MKPPSIKPNQSSFNRVPYSGSSTFVSSWGITHINSVINSSSIAMNFIEHTVPPMDVSCTRSLTDVVYYRNDVHHASEMEQLHALKAEKEVVSLTYMLALVQVEVLKIQAILQSSKAKVLRFHEDVLVIHLNEKKKVECGIHVDVVLSFKDDEEVGLHADIDI
ncbi:hypothetical protein ACFE04_021464 [Oxalis oulophora]